MVAKKQIKGERDFKLIDVLIVFAWNSVVTFTRSTVNSSSEIWLKMMRAGVICGILLMLDFCLFYCKIDVSDSIGMTSPWLWCCNGKFNIWDYRYYDRKYIEKSLDLDDMLVEEYFPVSVVVPAILEIYQNLLGVKFVEVKGETWHPGTAALLRYM